MHRRDRRPDRPLENPLIFYRRYVSKIIATHIGVLSMYLRYSRILKRVLRDTRPPEGIAMVPAQADDFEAPQRYTATEAAREQVEKPRRKVAAAASVSVP
jgi:hypothetical protein